MIITQPKEKIADFVSEQTDNTHFPFENYTCIGLLDKNGELIAGVLYNHFSGENICAHIAGKEGKRWLTKKFLHAMFDYPFNQLGVQRITGLVPKSNKDARKFDKHLGFKLEGNMRRALKDDDMLVYGMLKGECKWLKR